jgi:peptidyl-Asp metalloendopeptidase
MRKLHQRLMDKGRVYAKWHHSRAHGAIHWLLFLAVCVVATVYLYGITSTSYSATPALPVQNQAPEPSDLFSNTSLPTIPGNFGIAAKIVAPKLSLLESGAAALRLQLPDGKSIVVNKSSLEHRALGGDVWRGRMQNRTDSEVTLSTVNGLLAGSITVGQDIYEIRPVAGGQHVIEKVDWQKFPEEKDKVSTDTQATTSANVSTASVAGDVVQIDLLSVYTPQAKTAAGGDAQIQAVIQAAVDKANTAFINSQVNAHYNLVHTEQVNHNDAGNIDTDLNWVTYDSSVANMRNQYGADMVSLIIDNGGNYCGSGWVQTSPGPGFASLAYQVTARSCAVSNLSLAHEHGHNLGMDHDPANGWPPSYESYPWAYGHAVNGVFRTVMAYPSACKPSCPRVAYFSNPNVTYAGYPAGIANQRDNARVANSTVGIVAAFRTQLIPETTPINPSQLTASSVSSSQIKLTWADNATNESGFTIERSIDGLTFSQIANLSINTIAYSDINLASGTTYSYRVRAYNSVGNSAYSNIAAATTPTVVACTLANPSLSITPSSTQGAAGQPLVYTATMVNNNSSTCVPATFNISSAAPAGWSVSGTASFTLASGNSSNSFVTITSPTGTSVGTYSIPLTATNAAVPSYSANASAIYTIAATDAIPIVTILAPTNNATISKGKALSITGTATDDSQVNSVSLYVNGTLAQACVYNASNYICSWNVPNPKNRTYTLVVRATDGIQVGSSAPVQVTAK